MQPIVLWDIDGTLIRTRGGRVSATAFLRALRHVSHPHLPEDVGYPKDSGGKTDAQIALELLRDASIAEEHALEMVTGLSEVYLTELQGELVNLTADLRVLPGVAEILARLSNLGICQSVLTGNFEPIARLKLTAARLDHYVNFELGAYGSDNADRTCLVPISRQRLSLHFGQHIDPLRLVVVGDTPRDIACARSGGARVVAVATGAFSRADLEAHGPDITLDDLQDTDAVVAALLGPSE